MKRIFTLILTALLALSLSGCGGNRAVEKTPETAPVSLSTAETEEELPLDTQGTIPDEEIEFDTLEEVLAGTGRFYSADLGDNVTVEEFLARMGENSGVAFTIPQLARVDLDGDGTQEAALRLVAGEDNEIGTLILHFHHYLVTGWLFYTRQMQELKADGTYSWSGSAHHNGVSRLGFDFVGWYEETVLAQLDREDPEDEESQALVYEVDGQRVEEAAFQAFLDAQEKKPGTTWEAAPW